MTEKSEPGSELLFEYGSSLGSAASADGANNRDEYDILLKKRHENLLFETSGLTVRIYWLVCRKVKIANLSTVGNAAD